LKKVVFPDPLGPIMPKREPFRTRMETPSTARRPPKVRTRPSVSRMMSPLVPGTCGLGWMLAAVATAHTSFQRGGREAPAPARPILESLNDAFGEQPYEQNQG